jgi:TolB protein
MSSVTWSPDGRNLAFIVFDGVYVVHPNGHGLRQLVRGSVDDVSWSPRRPELAVSVVGAEDRDKPSAGEVEVVDLASAESRDVTHSKANDIDPAWSPDGDRLVFSSDRGGSFNLYIVDRDGHNLRRLTRSPSRDFVPAWSPDGETIVFRREEGTRAVGGGGSESLLQIGADGNKERVLLRSVPTENLNRCCWRVRWSPVNRRVATDLGATVTVVDVPSRRANVVVELGDDPQWSPDGTRILFASWIPVDCSKAQGYCIGARPTGLSVVDADGRHRINLTKAAKIPSVATAGSSWSPDGGRVAFVLDVDGERALALVDEDGQSFRRLHFTAD